MKNFNISEFENAFYAMLYKDFSLDITEFNRKICYHGRVMRIRMENSRIVSIVDLSGMHPVVLYSLETKTA